MPFSDTDTCTESEWTSIFEELIKPAVEGDTDLDYECHRSAPTRGNLVRGILEGLDESWVVIADLTDQNPNVYYELGIRHALADRTVIISQRRSDIRFDLQQYANHEYDPKTAAGRAEFGTRIRELLAEVDTNPIRPDNPVSDFLGQSQPDDTIDLEPRVANLESRLILVERELAAASAGGAVDKRSTELLGELGQLSLLDEPPSGRRWSDVAEVLAHGEYDSAFRLLVRKTQQDLTQRLPEEVRALTDTTNISARLAEDEIGPIARKYIERAEHLTANIEEFALAAASKNWIEGVRGILSIAGTMISIGSQLSGARFATGIPSFLAWRLLLMTGAKAVSDGSFEAVRVILSEPLEVERITGRITHRTLVENRELFFPETFLGHANTPMPHLDELWSSQLELAFGVPDEFREGLVSFLLLLALFDAGQDEEHRLLYPGYRLLSTADSAIQKFVGRIGAVPGFDAQVARVFDESASEFREKWAQRAKTANSAELGPTYVFNEVRVPTSLTES